MDKSRERRHLLSFKEIYPLFPEGEIEGKDDDREKPDFIVYAKNRTLGIEHTEVFQPSPSHGGSLQAQDSLAQGIVAKAKELYAHDYDQPLFVQILFNPNVKIGKRNIPAIAEKVAHLVGETHIEAGESITLRRTREVLELFPAEVALVHIYRYQGSNTNDWFCSSAGFIARIDKGHIQAVIDKKERKLENYELCSEMWLLIVADEVRIPSAVDLDDSAARYNYETRFDRIFFFWNSSRRYVELPVAQRGSQG